MTWLLPTLSAAALWACNGNKLDQDGDGFTELTGDCDDLDANVHPDAQEVCYNGIDDNCNGVEDEEGATSGRVWYIDLDGDGYGKEDVTVLACDQPENYAAEKWDCQEDNAAIHPGAAEVCDYVDNDCDGEVDEASSEDAVVWYPDRDGDGYGDADAAVHSCEPIPGFVNEAGDCNDSDPGMSPDRTEVCTTPLDEDCDGETNDPDAYGCTDFYADLDGDGFAGTTACLCEAEAPYLETEATDCDDTRADVYPGAPSRSRFGSEDCNGERALDLSSPDAVLTGTPQNAGALFDVVDLNLDDTSDLLVSGYHTTGPAFVIEGPLTDHSSLNDARLFLPEPGVGEYGYANAVVDDLDGDGTRDIAWAWTGDGSGSAGIYFFSGAATGALTVDDAIGHLSADPILVWSTRPELASGDFDGDGDTELFFRDAVVGPTLVHPSLGETSASFPLSMDSMGGTAGTQVEASDVNGDGLTDLVIANQFAGLPSFLNERSEVPSVSGAVLAYLAPIDEDTLPSFWVYDTYGNVGSSSGDFAFMDLDRDGIEDLLLTQYWMSHVQPSAGMASGLLGPFDTYTMVGTDWPSIWDATHLISGTEEGQQLGRLAVLDDLTGDGHADLFLTGAAGVAYFFDRFEEGHQRADGMGRMVSEPLWGDAKTVTDLNGDGARELVAAIWNADERNYELHIFFGDAP